MARTGLNEDVIVRKALNMANTIGFDKITLKTIADELNIQTPSLYNHIKSIDDLKKQMMLYGWSQLEKDVINSAENKNGYDALRSMCYAFYNFAVNNPGAFNAMLWYNKFDDSEAMTATDKLFSIFFRITDSLNISRKNANHLIRTFRSFLEGFSLLVNNNAFGNPLSIKESFDLSLDILIAGMQSLEETADI